MMYIEGEARTVIVNDIYMRYKKRLFNKVT